MTIFALCLALQADRVGELLRALGDDSVEVREAASGDLVRLGEAAQAPLEKARKGASDPEVAARIDDVLQQIFRDARRRDFAGGAPVDGLSASLRTREDPLKGELKLTVEVMNVGLGAR